MTRPVVVIAVALVALCALTGSPTAAVGTDQAADLAHDPANVARFRESFGLRSDPAYVQQSVTSDAVFSDLTYGVPLIKAEAADIASRQDRAVASQKALDYAMSLPDYSGMYFDQRRGGVAVFLVTQDAMASAQQIGSLMPNGAPYEVQTVPATLHALEATYATIGSELPALQASMPITTVEVDVKSNSVVVGLRSPVAGAETTLRDRYGDRVSVQVTGSIQEDSCTSRNNCGGTSTDPWKGGIKIFLAGNQGFWCTSGILARRGSNLVMITAAHCLVNSPADYGDNWKHNTNDPRKIGDALGGTIGDANGYPGDGCSPCHADVGWIDIDTHSTVTPLDLFLADNNGQYVWGVIGTPGDNDALQQVGSLICRSGAKSGWICGQIDVLHASKSNLDGHNVTDLRRTDFDASPGDSGGTMNNGHQFLGIHNDSKDGVDPPDPGNSWYSTGDQIWIAGNRVCEEASC
jgi:hypothetical protein